MKSVSESYFRTLVDASPAILWVTRADGYCTYLSRQWYDFTGREIEADLGLGWTENVHPEDREAAATEFMRCSQERCLYEITFRLRRKDGEYRWVIDKGNPHYSDTGEYLGFVGTVIDIHEQKMVQKDLQSLQERSRRMAEATQVGVWYCDLPFSDLIWSDEVKKHFWLSPDTQVTIDLFYERIHPEDRQLTEAAINASIANHTPYQVDYRTTNPDRPEEVKWIRAIGWTDYDSKGNAIRFDGLTLDVSEEVKLRQEMLSALASRDEFLSVASHELKTPLTTLLLQSQLLKRFVELNNLSPERMRSITEKTESQIKRLSRLVDDMMDISRIRTGRLSLNKGPTNLTFLTHEIVQKLAEEFNRMQVKLPEIEVEDLIQGNWDALRIEQVMSNLLINALRYGKKSPVSIKLELLKDKQRARVTISDKGPGIDFELQHKIFKRFERAISPDEVSGLGLGLYISKQIIESHGGEIGVRSRPGEGASFYFELPLN